MCACRVSMCACRVSVCACRVSVCVFLFSLSTKWVLGFEFRLSDLAASIFTCWAILSAPNPIPWLGLNINPPNAYFLRVSSYKCAGGRAGPPCKPCAECWQPVFIHCQVSHTNTCFWLSPLWAPTLPHRDFHFFGGFKPGHLLCNSWPGELLFYKMPIWIICSFS